MHLHQFRAFWAIYHPFWGLLAFFCTTFGHFYGNQSNKTPKKNSFSEANTNPALPSNCCKGSLPLVWICRGWQRRRSGFQAWSDLLDFWRVQVRTAQRLGGRSGVPAVSSPGPLRSRPHQTDPEMPLKSPSFYVVCAAVVMCRGSPVRCRVWGPLIPPGIFSSYRVDGKFLFCNF